MRCGACLETYELEHWVGVGSAALQHIAVSGFPAGCRCVGAIDACGSAADSLELDMARLGQMLMGTEKYQYLLPFEAISVLLLACIIGGIVVARKK